MDYKNITLEDITNSFYSLIKEREEDVNVKPDIVIKDDGELFWAAIDGGNTKLTTGIGGLKMYFDNFSDISFMKVQWNGITLNEEQKQELFKKIKYGSK